MKAYEKNHPGWADSLRGICTTPRIPGTTIRCLYTLHSSWNLCHGRGHTCWTYNRSGTRTDQWCYQPSFSTSYPPPAWSCLPRSILWTQCNWRCTITSRFAVTATRTSTFGRSLSAHWFDRCPPTSCRLGHQSHFYTPPTNDSRCGRRRSTGSAHVRTFLYRTCIYHHQETALPSISVDQPNVMCLWWTKQSFPCVCVCVCVCVCLSVCRLIEAIS